MYYEKHIFICDNKREPGQRVSCSERNSEILKYLKQNADSYYKGSGSIRIQRAGCLDRCELGPILVSYPEGLWFSLKSLDDAKRFLEMYIAGNDLLAIEDLAVSDNEKI